MKKQKKPKRQFRVTLGRGTKDADHQIEWQLKYGKHILCRIARSITRIEEDSGYKTLMAQADYLNDKNYAPLTRIGVEAIYKSNLRVWEAEQLELIPVQNDQ